MRARYEGLNFLYVKLPMKYQLCNNVLTTAAVKCRNRALVKQKALQRRYIKDVDVSY